MELKKSVFANGPQRGKLIGQGVVDALGTWSLDRPASAPHPLDSIRASIASPLAGRVTTNIRFKR